MDARAIEQRLGEWIVEDRPLYRALADAIGALIEAGELPEGLRLPSERRLATTLDVSRGTVVRAYEALRDDELVHTRQGSGTIVGAGTVAPLGTREARLAEVLSPGGIFRGLLELDPDAIDLRGAYWVGLDDLPTELFEITRHDLAAVDPEHGYHPLGIWPLREALAKHLTGQGLATDPDEVLVTSGGQQAISLLAQTLLGPGDRVLVEALSFPGAVDAFAAAEARCVPVPVGPHGVDTTALREAAIRHRPRLVYLIPSVQNPTGTVAPHGARRLIAEALKDTSALVVDDATLAATAFAGEVPLPLAAYLDPARTVTIGSLSKTVWAGLRIGWIRAPRPLLARIARVRSVADLGGSVASQLIGARVLDHADELLPARRVALRHRYDVLAEELTARLPEWRWDPPAGGLCIWADLGGVSSVEFAATAARHGVGITPGTASAVGGSGGEDHLRLPYGHRPEVLRAAVERLAHAWREHRSLGTGRRVGVVV